MSEVYSCRTCELIDDDSFSAIDDEGASVGHDREVAEKNLPGVFPDLSSCVSETDDGFDGSGPSHIFLPGFFFRDFRFLDGIADKFESEVAIKAFDWENFLQEFLKPLRFSFIRRNIVLKEPVVRISLNAYHIGHFN